MGSRQQGPINNVTKNNVISAVLEKGVLRIELWEISGSHILLMPCILFVLPPQQKKNGMKRCPFEGVGLLGGCQL